jgi:uncharacterized membrane protein
LPSGCGACAPHLAATCRFGQLNVWLGTVVLLILVWSMKAGVKPGLNMHLLGATIFTLMFGRQLAVIGFSLVLAGRYAERQFA